MAYLSHAIIRSVCVVCVALYAVNLALLILSWLIARRHGGVVASLREDWGALARRSEGRWGLLGFGGAMLAVAGALMGFYPSYWKLNEPVGPAGMPHGINADGHAWIGVRKDLEPQLVIHEFSDYQCGFCRHANALVRQALQKPGIRGRVRLIHHHYPLDIRCNPTVPREFHPRACELARGAVCAGEQGKFWEMNDLLFRRQRRPGGPDLLGMAGKLGLDMARFGRCIESPETRMKVKGDIDLGERMSQEAMGQGIRGTPLYLFQRPGEQLRRGLPTEAQIRLALKRFPDQHGPGGLPHGRTAEGLPWIGAERPVLTLAEVSDYECHHCVREHFRLRELLSQPQLRDGLRLVHVQYPFDSECNPAFEQRQHPRACELARAALCAGEQGKFWEMNDLLMRSHRKGLRLRAQSLGPRLGLDDARYKACFQAPGTRERLSREVAFAERLGRRGGKGIEAIPALFFRRGSAGWRPVRNLSRKAILKAMRGRGVRGGRGRRGAP